SGSCFPVGNIPDRLVEISADTKWPDSSVKQSCHNCADVRGNREIGGGDQPEPIADRHKKKNKRSLSPHELVFLVSSGACVKHEVRHESSFRSRERYSLIGVCFL